MVHNLPHRNRTEKNGVHRSDLLTTLVIFIFDNNIIAGLENIHLLTQINGKLSIFLGAHDGETRRANYSTFKISSESDQYRLEVGQAEISFIL